MTTTKKVCRRAIPRGRIQPRRAGLSPRRTEMSRPVVTRPLWMQRVSGYDFRTYNPFRFSSEYADDALGLVYYNYRHYNPLDGRWTSRDPIGEMVLPNMYGMCYNEIINFFDVLGMKVFWSTRDLDYSPWGNHHFITFSYDCLEDAPTVLRGELFKVSCSKECKTKYVMFMGLKRDPVEEYVEKRFLWKRWKKKRIKYNIGVYQVNSHNKDDPKNDHLNDLVAYKEKLCGEEGFWSDLDYEAHEITGYANETVFVSKLLDLYKKSEKNFKDYPVEYSLTNRNCATWVNCILKAAGISAENREKTGEFPGFDWGEEDETLDAWFKE